MLKQSDSDEISAAHGPIIKNGKVCSNISYHHQFLKLTKLLAKLADSKKRGCKGGGISDGATLNVSKNDRKVR